MGVLWQVDFHSSGMDLVVVPLLDPSSALMLGGRDVTKGQREESPKGKRRADLEAGLSSDLHQVIPWVAHNHGWMSLVGTDACECS